MKISDLLSSIYQRNSLLFWGGTFSLLLFAVAFILSFFDSTIILGINAWIKPMKFGLSVWIYLWTFAWLLHYLPSARKTKWISWGILLCMLVENFAIFFQAMRGQTSHYNISSEFNAGVFTTMGVFIGINSLINLYTLILFFTEKVNLQSTDLFAWRAGLFFFIVGGIAGGLMVNHMSHTVGAADGGTGLPFLNWSTQAGDLRVAHFITLHGLQIIPLLNFLIAKRTENPIGTTQGLAFAYAITCIILHAQALTGMPLLAY